MKIKAPKITKDMDAWQKRDDSMKNKKGIQDVTQAIDICAA